MFSQTARHVLRRHGDRSRHRQHAGLRQGPRHRPERAFGGRASPPAAARSRSSRSATRPSMMLGRTPGNIEAIRPAARRRHRRLRGRRGDDQALHPQGAQPAQLRQPAGDHLRALRLDRGRAARHPGIGRERRRPAGVPDRGADGGGDRRRPAGHRADRLDGGRYRRRHHRGRGAVAGRHRLCPLGPRRRRQDGRGDHRLHPPQPQPAGRRGHAPSGSRRNRLRLPARGRRRAR